MNQTPEVFGLSLTQVLSDTSMSVGTIKCFGAATDKMSPLSPIMVVFIGKARSKLGRSQNFRSSWGYIFLLVEFFIVCLGRGVTDKMSPHLPIMVVLLGKS